MKGNLEAEVTVSIDANTSEVWKAITTPAVIREYLMGTKVSTDWKEGSPITYEGEYKGKSYKDKGIVKKVKPGKILQTTYWSSMGGKEDRPENYNLVTYKLEGRGERTLVTLTQDNIKSEDEKEHVTGNWKSVLTKLKEIVEE
ncbi:MAG TPA: SRPBCC family protein [Puia sp.]|nr:SRPBCC family protein [Puia sp.]